ncbi:DUF2927 domain-containing protein [Neptuniibacter halophilus]|uniref:DUF2927 domain-containing protein n=1 Tax=Neptuniibacter halophilus TaxID=651666 RepID=UPI0025725F68|nr:DUF2927 domain-containing protein [Neptuniibacter halophilus]
MLLRLLLFVALSVPAWAAEPPRWQQPGFIQQAFFQVALRNEYKAGTGVLRRWQQPVRVWIDHQVADQALHTDLVKMHLKHLQAITGHSVSLVSKRDQANLILLFTRQARWQQDVGRLLGKAATRHTRGAVCMANFRLNRRAEIDWAAVVIPVDQARMHGKLVACIVEELTQVLGLPNDSEQAYPSIFNDKTPEDLLTGLDYLLLKLLYRPELKPGMTQQQLRPVVQNLLRQWQIEGTIGSAAQQVRRGELYPLLGY